MSSPTEIVLPETVHILHGCDVGLAVDVGLVVMVGNEEMVGNHVLVGVQVVVGEKVGVGGAEEGISGIRTVGPSCAVTTASDARAHHISKRRLGWKPFLSISMSTAGGGVLCSQAVRVGRGMELCMEMVPLDVLWSRDITL